MYVNRDNMGNMGREGILGKEKQVGIVGEILGVEEVGIQGEVENVVGEGVIVGELEDVGEINIV